MSWGGGSQPEAPARGWLPWPLSRWGCLGWPVLLLARQLILQQQESPPQTLLRRGGRQGAQCKPGSESQTRDCVPSTESNPSLFSHHCSSSKGRSPGPGRP